MFCPGVVIIAFYFGQAYLMGWINTLVFLIVSLERNCISASKLAYQKSYQCASLCCSSIFSMLWLFLFRDSNYMNFAFLTIGTAAIIIANLLLNFGSKIRTGYKSLILALWLCGTSVYLLLQNTGFYDYFNLI